MIYPPEVIDEVCRLNDIVTVVSAHVQLKQRGRNFVGLCPFHRERTPSFSVSQEMQMFKCFGCGVSGNIIGFVMQYENMPFLDALKTLADRAGYVLPVANTSDRDKWLKQQADRDKLYEIQIVAAKLFHENLMDNKVGMSYLLDRGVSHQMIRKFGLGYAKGGSQIYGKLMELGYDLSLIEKSGLVVPISSDNQSSFRDKFYDRIMFPIINERDKLVGFGGRVIRDAEPKYLNSPETPIFEKSKILYGINFARKSRKREYIVVEGYMDAISLYQEGFHNVVGSMGTALNSEHAKKIRSVADSVILVFDSDGAGTQAALRAIPPLTAEGLGVKILQVVGAKDPDQYIKENGAESFAALLAKASHHTVFSIENASKAYDLTQTGDKVRFTNEAANILAKLGNAIERDVYTRDVAERMGISRNAIEQEITNIVKKEGQALQRQSAIRDVQRIRPMNETNVTKARKEFINLMFNEPKLRDKLSLIIIADEMCDEHLTELLREIYSQSETLTAAQFISRMEDGELHKLAADILFDSYKLIDGSLEVFVNNLIRQIKLSAIDEKFAKTDKSDMKTQQELRESRQIAEKLHISITNG
jgi:DNA primase